MGVATLSWSMRAPVNSTDRLSSLETEETSSLLMVMRMKRRRKITRMRMGLILNYTAFERGIPT